MSAAPWFTEVAMKLSNRSIESEPLAVPVAEAPSHSRQDGILTPFFIAFDLGDGFPPCKELRFLGWLGPANALDLLKESGLLSGAMRSRVNLCQDLGVGNSRTKQFRGRDTEHCAEPVNGACSDVLFSHFHPLIPSEIGFQKHRHLLLSKAMLRAHFAQALGNEVQKEHHIRIEILRQYPTVRSDRYSPKGMSILAKSLT